MDPEACQEDILKWADTAIYQAKNVGGNLVLFHDSIALIYYCLYSYMRLMDMV